MIHDGQVHGAPLPHLPHPHAFFFSPFCFNRSGVILNANTVSAVVLRYILARFVSSRLSLDGLRPFAEISKMTKTNAAAKSYKALSKL